MRPFARQPGIYPGRFYRPSGNAAPPPLALATIPAFGPAGAATFVLELEPGAKLTYAWLTEVITHYDGTEQRVSWQALPSLRIEGQAFMLDGDDRANRAALMRAAARGATFLCGLPMEEVGTVGDPVGATFAADTTLCDWALPGQRVLVLGPDGASGPAVVQDSTATTIRIDAVPAGVTARGAVIMPLVPIVLDAQQGFTRYPVNVGLWDVRAKSTAFGWCGQDVFGRGALVLTLDAGLVSVDALTDTSAIVWDRENAVAGTAADSLASGAEVVDLGGAIFAAGGQAEPDWIRPIKLVSGDPIDHQWLKAVARHLRGSQGSFVLSTGRADLLFVSAPAFGALIVTGDYTSWSTSLAHRTLAITANSGPVQYLAVTSAIDNGDGTNTIYLSDNPFGPIDSISFAELVRLETDVVAPVWDGAVMTVDLVARVVQDTPAEDIVTSAWAGHGLDGDFTFPVGVFTMARDMYWETGQLQAGSIVDANGFVPRFRTACVAPPTGTAIIRRNGNHAVGATAGVGFVVETDDPVNAGTIGGGSGSGAHGGNGAGAAPPGITDGFWPARLHPGAGGAGGNGTNAGHAGETIFTNDDAAGSMDVFAAVRMRLESGSTQAISGGGGGGGGGGSGTQPGGGGGAGAGNLVIVAGRFVNPANLLIQAIGGAGGAPTGANAGGGGGGGGGDVAVVAGALPLPPIANIDTSGGAGGAGFVGVPGAAGSPGSTMLFIG